MIFVKGLHKVLYHLNINVAMFMDLVELVAVFYKLLDIISD